MIYSSIAVSATMEGGEPSRTGILLLYRDRKISEYVTGCSTGMYDMSDENILRIVLLCRSGVTFIFENDKKQSTVICEPSTSENFVPWRESVPLVSLRPPPPTSPLLYYSSIRVCVVAVSLGG